MPPPFSTLIHPEEYRYLGLWKQDLYPAWFWVEWYDKELAEQFQVPLTEGGICIVNGHFAVKHAVMEAVRQCFLEKVKEKDQVFFDRLTSLALENLDHIEEESRRIVASEMMPAVWQSYLALGRRIMFPWCLFVLFSYCVDEVLLAGAEQEGIDPGTVSSLIPSVRTLLTEEHEAAQTLKTYLDSRPLFPSKDDAEAWSKLETYRQRFGWIEMANFIGEPLTVERCLHRLTHLAEDAHASVPSRELSPHLIFLTTIAAQVSRIRQLSAEYFAVFTYHTQPFLQKVANRLTLSYRELLHLLPEEIESGLFHAASHGSLQELVKRRAKDGYVLSSINHQLLLWDSPQDVRDAERLFVPSVDESTDQLKGATAYPGRVTGTAKIILHTDEFYKMADGDVLVTTMTTPDFILLMQRASAIVTDIGGLLSHAAIVSRELKKPCLIGTKFATNIFKDGQTIEVNATEGWVRKKNASRT